MFCPNVQAFAADEPITKGRGLLRKLSSNGNQKMQRLIKSFGKKGYTKF